MYICIMSVPIITISAYIESKTSLASKIVAIDALIDTMISKSADAIGSAETASYRMDDGQVIIQTEHRNPNDVFAAVQSLEKMKQIYVNRYNSRRTILRGRLNNGYHR